MSAGNRERKLGMSINYHASGAAALAICGSILLCLGDRKILSEHEIIGILEDAITAHQIAPADDGLTKIHEAVATLINGIIDGKNSVRRPH
jgi:hypothetical protein